MTPKKTIVFISSGAVQEYYWVKAINNSREGAADDVLGNQKKHLFLERRERSGAVQEYYSVEAVNNRYKGGGRR